MQLIVPTTSTTIMQHLPLVANNNLAMLQGPAGIAFTCLQVVVMLSSYSTEMKQAMPYSKFAHLAVEQQETKKNDNTTVATAKATTTKQQIPFQVSSRVGMLIIYTPALLMSALVLSTGIVPSTTIMDSKENITLAGIMCLIHFIKRDLEVLYLHQYSGSTPLATASLIGFFYAVNALLTCAVATSTPSVVAVQLGTLLFVIGILGNFYHHYLLATLRNNNNNTTNNIAKEQYFAPRGGLFEYVAAPHYLFELVGWLGIAICSQHVNVYLVFAGMVSYLAARAKRQNEWNRNQFSKAEWPASRRNLVPFLF